MADKHQRARSSAAVDRSEGFGERLLGSLLDRANQMPPHLIAPLIEQEIAIIGGRDVELLLQDYDQMTLVSLIGEELVAGGPQPIDRSLAGEAFRTDRSIEQKQEDGVRSFVPLAMIGAMGHGLSAALLATLAVGAHRHARRIDVGLGDLYAAMDKAIASEFGPDKFVTAQMARLDVSSGLLHWVNAIRRRFS